MKILQRFIGNTEGTRALPDSGSGGEDKDGGEGVGGRDPLDLESFPHDCTQLDDIPPSEPTKKVGGGARDPLDEELELATGAGEGGRRGDGEEGGLVGGGDAELEVLAGDGVGDGEVGGVGDVDGDVE